MKKQYMTPQVEKSELTSLSHLCDVSAGGDYYSPVTGAVTE